MIAQYLGAFLGAALVFFTYKVIVCKIFFFCFWLFCNYIFLTSIQFKEWKILKLTTTGCNWYVHRSYWGLSGFFSFIVFSVKVFSDQHRILSRLTGKMLPLEYLWLFPGRASQTSMEQSIRFFVLSLPGLTSDYFYSPRVLSFFQSKVVGSALLLFAISAINNPANSSISTRYCHFIFGHYLEVNFTDLVWNLFCPSLGPLLVGLVVVNIGICFGHNAG